jgi:hypothetical protein
MAIVAVIAAILLKVEPIDEDVRKQNQEMYGK